MTAPASGCAPRGRITSGPMTSCITARMTAGPCAMLNVLDEFTRESLAIRVRRKLSSIDGHRRADRPVHPARHPGTYIRSDNGPEFVAEAVQAVDRCGRRPHRLHRAGLTLGERLYRELQCPAARRAPERGDLLHPEGSPGSHRIVAAPLQRRTSTQQPGIPAAGPGDDRHAKLAARLRYAPPATQLGRGTRDALTFDLDHSTGAGQDDPGAAVFTRPFLQHDRRVEDVLDAVNDNRSIEIDHIDDSLGSQKVRAPEQE